jgi:arginine N-succinyltransferase
VHVILLREIQERDIDDVEKLAQIPGFLNLQPDKDVLRERLQHSQQSFQDKLANKMDAKFMFVAEDLESRRVIGTSMIAAQHGTVDSPHFYFEVGSEEKFSETINTGFIHGTLKLKYDTNGPSEIGGLVMDPAHRNSEARIGRQISFVRFLFIGMNKGRFKRKLLTELLPPLNKKGQSPLWEAIGRRFTNMDYWEADQLCQKNKEFIFSLFPSGKIYTTFLPAEARNALGKVGKDTEPVVHMLTKIGFQYRNQVDPFDGGPHLWAGIDDLVPIKKLGSYTYDPAVASSSSEGSSEGSAGLLTRAVSSPGEFRAVAVKALHRDGKLAVAGEPARKQLEAALGIAAGEPVVFMPFY